MKNLIHFLVFIAMTISIYSCDNLLSTKKGNESLYLQLSYDTATYSGPPEVIQQIISSRLLNFGLDAEQFSIKFKNNQIEVIVRQLANASDLTDLITREGKLEFWETYEFKEIMNGIMVSNDKIPVEKMEKSTVKNSENDEQPANSGEFNYDAVKQNSNVDSSKLFTYFRPNIIMNEKQQYEAGVGAVVGITRIMDTLRINHYLQKEEVSINFPRDLKFMWGLKPPVYANGEELLELFSIKAYRGEPVLNGSHMTKTMVKNSKKGILVTFNFNNEGTRILRRLTQNNINKSIAITIDNNIIYCATVLQIIENGKMELSGNGLSLNETEIIAALINGGNIPIKLNIISKKIEKK